MKRRLGLVSNSSSSSYIVIDTTDTDFFPNEKDAMDELVIDGTKGEVEFGWGLKTITDMWSRINFSYLQALYTKWHEPWRKEIYEKSGKNVEMLEDTLKKFFGAKKITWKISHDWDCEKDETHGYIDHQSAAYEGKNLEMFESPEILAQFLFGKNSKIELDNDNG